MIIHKYDDFFIGTETIKDYYIYGWVCENWGGVYFYVGKGCGNRYKSLHNRSRAFMSFELTVDLKRTYLSPFCKIF